MTSGGSATTTSSNRGTRLFVRRAVRFAAHWASGRDSFNDGLRDARRNDAAQLPARCREQLAKLLFCALAAARKNQHLKVQEFARGEIVAGLDYVVHHEQFAA